MGGPRASTQRGIDRGDLCCVCQVPCNEPRRCPKCAGNLSEAQADARVHRVYMQFFVRGNEGQNRDTDVWIVNFLTENCTNSAGRIRRWEDFNVVRGIAERGGALKTLADRQALDYAEMKGRGSVVLTLTEAQYRKLR